MGIGILLLAGDVLAANDLEGSDCEDEEGEDQQDAVSDKHCQLVW